MELINCGFVIPVNEEVDFDDDKKPRKHRVHNPKKKRKPTACSERIECDVCGYCIRHCLSHTQIRQHIKTAFRPTVSE